MNDINYVFDATQYDPSQVSPKHPPGKFLATITATDIKPTKENTGGFYEVEFKTQAGTAYMRFNLWNQNQTSVDIAHRQLSALCHCVGIYKVTMQGKGRELINGRCMIEVAEQADPKYTQIVKFYDVNGNEPAKGQPVGQAAPQPQPQQPGPVAPQPNQWQGGAATAAPGPQWSGQVTSGQPQVGPAQPQPQLGPNGMQWNGPQPQLLQPQPGPAQPWGVQPGPDPLLARSGQGPGPNPAIQGQPAQAWQPPAPQQGPQPQTSGAPPWAQQR